jgi:HD-GYP domain-containing protein (c-di-GMP phosphodiesterase class II)
MLEISLIVVVVGLTALFHQMEGFKIVVLNLFYLPIVLAGFFLGRYRAGGLAVLCVICVSIITVLDLRGFATMNSPLVIALATVIWGAVLALAAILVGTLSDERNQKIDELHEAYVGVVEVLSKYLQSANPHMQQRSEEIAEMSQKVAVEMSLSPKEVDDIRVAALLHDMENVEVTSRVIEKALVDMEQESPSDEPYTFYGTDLAHSLGSVLKGALPLLLEQNRIKGDSADATSTKTGSQPHAQIIQAARAFVILREELSADGTTGEEVVARMQQDEHRSFASPVLTALYRVVSETPEGSSKQREPAGAV